MIMENDTLKAIFWAVMLVALTVDGIDARIAGSSGRIVVGSILCIACTVMAFLSLYF